MKKQNFIPHRTPGFSMGFPAVDKFLRHRDNVMREQSSAIFKTVFEILITRIRLIPASDNMVINIYPETIPNLTNWIFTRDKSRDKWEISRNSPGFTAQQQSLPFS